MILHPSAEAKEAVVDSQRLMMCHIRVQVITCVYMHGSVCVTATDMKCDIAEVSPYHCDIDLKPTSNPCTPT